MIITALDGAATCGCPFHLVLFLYVHVFVSELYDQYRDVALKICLEKDYWSKSNYLYGMGA